ncbi:MAG: hypothetical protein QOJ79_132 [Actinomycetota bacterium]|jgi:uncharacterized membrane protein|nr:hypothetical protein [Actinomycetota bacterium]
MRSVYRVLVALLAAEVLVQGMAITFAIARLFYWIDQDGGVANKALFDNDNAHYPGATAFMIHGMNGLLLMPIIALLLLIVSFFAKVAGGTKRAGILVGLVVLQAALGLFAHAVPALVMLHVLNAFALFSYAAITAHRMGSADHLETAGAATV